MLSSPKNSLNWPSSLSKSTSVLEYQSFCDWLDFKKQLKEELCLVDACIALRPDYLQSESIETLDEVRIENDSGDEVLISISAGLRVGLSVSLTRSASPKSRRIEWPPKAEYGAILKGARDVLCRAIRDRVVELMSGGNRDRVVSLFLDSKGSIESASKKAQAFCDTHFSAKTRVNGYFEPSQWDYVQGAIRRLQEGNSQGYQGESLVFCFGEENGIVDCLLQKMGNNGYLLSLAMDR